jgi:anti-sigma-K factor RskA
MHEPSPELIDRLAAEYVLGTLRGAARRRFARWLSASPTSPPQAAAVDAVRRWEDRLASLLQDVPPALPSPQVWAAIERRLRAEGAIGVARRAARWRPWAVAASLLVVAFGAWWFVGLQGRTQWQTTALVRDAIQREPLWRVEIDRDTQRLRVSAVAPYALDPGRVHELWALRDGAAPVSLGVLPQRGAVERSLAPAQRAALLRARNLAVSLEPAGGSPSGAPTGPVRVVIPLQLGS